MGAPSGRSPIPADDEARVAAVRATGLLDAEPDPLLDTVTDLIAAALGVPIALVTLIDEDRQWFASRHGLGFSETPRDHAFCAHAIMRPDELFVVEDAADDDRFAANPLVTGLPHIRFYAGAPVRGAGGHPLGSLCAIDTEPRCLDRRDLDLLERAARQVEALLSVRSERNAAGNGRDRIRSRRVDVEEAAEERTRFLAIAQHKLKTPLAVISGWSAMLQKGDQLSVEEHRAGLEAINRSTVEIQVQINDLLDEARSRVLEQTIHLEPVELAPILGEQISALSFDEERHAIELDIDHGLRVRADQDALRQVVTHVLDNAVKYSPGGGTITVSTKIEGDRAVIAVRDPGIGLPDKVDVFEPFQRGATPPGVAGGTGLGLYVVRSLMTSMRGDVRAVSTDVGTSIELSLPRA